jgi:uncharacterized protein
MPYTHKGFVIRRCKFGYGVFTLSDIKKGKRVITLRGENLTPSGYRSLHGKAAVFTMRTGVNAYCHLDKTTRYLNHSCDPNTFLMTDRSLFAARDIKAGEEITFDYSTSSDEGWVLSCRCGSKGCRKKVGRFRDLDAKTKARFLRLKAAPPWLLKVIVK